MLTIAIHTYMHIHTYIHAYTYIYTYIHTYTQSLLNFFHILQSGENVTEYSYLHQTSTSGEEFVKTFNEPGANVSDLVEDAELATGVVVTELLLDQLCEKVRSRKER